MPLARAALPHLRIRLPHRRAALEYVHIQPPRGRAPLPSESSQQQKAGREARLLFLIAPGWGRFPPSAAGQPFPTRVETITAKRAIAGVTPFSLD